MRVITIMKFLKCSECNNVFPIHRKANRNRKNGHIKHMYCIGCRKTTKHIELSEEEAFKININLIKEVYEP